MIDVHELGGNAAVLDRVPGLDFDQIEFVRLVLFEFRPDQRERERRADDRTFGKLAQEIRDAADVVFVSVRHEQRLELVAAIAQIAEVVDHDVDAEHLFVGEHQTAVDHDDIVGGLEDGHVAADFAAAAQRNDANVRFAWGRRDDQRVGVGLAVQSRAGSLLKLLRA